MMCVAVFFLSATIAILLGRVKENFSRISILFSGVGMCRLIKSMASLISLVFEAVTEAPSRSFCLNKANEILNKTGRDF